MSATVRFHKSKWFWGAAGALVVYLILIRWLLLGYLYDQDLLTWYTVLIEEFNRITRTNFGQGIHPLEEYRQRADIFLFQAFLLATVGLSLWHAVRSRERALLFAINGVALLAILLVTEVILSTDHMQKRFGSIQYEEANRLINEVNARRVNSLGFTDRERAFAGEPGVYRIAVLGDSFVWGDGVSNLEDAWSHVLEDLLVERYGDAVEVLSWGRNGWSTYDQVEFLKDGGREFDIDLLVVGLVNNDSHVPGVSMARRMFVWHKLAKRIAPFLGNTVRFMSSRANNFLYGLEYFENWGMGGWAIGLRTEQNLAAYATVIDELRSHLRERGIEFFFVSLPTVGEGDLKRQFDPVLEVLETEGVDYLDLRPMVLQRYVSYGADRIRNELWTNPANGHPSRTLTDLYATETLEYLLRKVELDERIETAGPT